MLEQLEVDFTEDHILVIAYKLSFVFFNIIKIYVSIRI